MLMLSSIISSISSRGTKVSFVPGIPRGPNAKWRLLLNEYSQHVNEKTVLEQSDLELVTID